MTLIFKIFLDGIPQLLCFVNYKRCVILTNKLFNGYR